MQELRLVAVSEDGSYLVLATAGRGTRFTLPVDDRLRAAVRGHFSRLGQFEIEVESPLRPKEIQARIRAGETAEEIAETAGIPVERVRWFEGPVLQEREYMAQQAQRVVVRRQGEGSPGPSLGEMVEDRLGRRGVDLEEVEWDSWKCEDSTWRVRLSFFHDGRPFAAEWVFDPRRRQVSALDEEAARLSSLDVDTSVTDTVTPLMPRRAAMKIVSDPEVPASPRAPRPPAPPPRDPQYGEPTATESDASEPVAAERPGDDDLEEILAATQDEPSTSRPEPVAHDDEAEAVPEPEPEPAPERETVAEAPAKQRPTRQHPKESPQRRPERPSRSEPAPPPPDERVADRTEHDEEVPAEEVAEHVAAAANGGAVAPAAQTPPAAQTQPAAKTPPAQPGRNRRKGSNRGKRASVPSWDEIMFGSRRPE